MNNQEREKIRREANKAAEDINNSIESLRKSPNGKIKVLSLESLAVLTGISFSGICKFTDIPIETALPLAALFAIPNVITSALIPHPNKLSEKINYETIKYLIGTMIPYTGELYKHYFR